MCIYRTHTQCTSIIHITADWLASRYSDARVLAAPIAGFYFFSSSYDGSDRTDNCPGKRLYTYTHTYIHTYIHTYMHTCMHACMHVCTCMRVWMYVCVHIYLLEMFGFMCSNVCAFLTHLTVCMSMNEYIHTFTYIHLYACIYTCVLE
jgi:hypothetical protein